MDLNGITNAVYGNWRGMLCGWSRVRHLNQALSSSSCDLIQVWPLLAGITAYDDEICLINCISGHYSVNSVLLSWARLLVGALKKERWIVGRESRSWYMKEVDILILMWTRQVPASKLLNFKMFFGFEIIPLWYLIILCLSTSWGTSPRKWWWITCHLSRVSWITIVTSPLNTYSHVLRWQSSYTDPSQYARSQGNPGLVSLVN
jgi:hypothetical protein